MPQTLPSIVLPQLSILRDTAGPRVVGRSAGIPFEIEEHALKLAVKFGVRPEGTTCPPGVFVVRSQSGPLIFLTTFAELPGHGSTLAFRTTYFDTSLRGGIDPLDYESRFPAKGAKGDLDPIEWEGATGPQRTVATVRDILKAGDSSLLLGVAQALLDGCKIALIQSEVGPNFAREVWQLLPEMARAELTVATFACSVDLNVNLAVLPDGVPIPSGFLTANQAREYPEGRYELALQLAAENGNQAELDRLFARKTSNQILRMVVAMILFALVAGLILKFI